MVQTKRPKTLSPTPESIPEQVVQPHAKVNKIILVCFLLSGASGLIYQVVWLRMLTLIFGATSFAISTVLTSFMAGLAAGSIYAGRRTEKMRRPLLVYILMEVGIGLYGLLLLLILPALSPIYGAVWQQFHLSFLLLSLVRFVLVAIVLLPPTLLMGATLPVLSAYYAQSKQRLALSIGSLYFVNTFGAVFGAAVSGFWLLPMLGVTKTVFVAAGFNFGLALLAVVPLRYSPAVKEIVDKIKEKRSSRKVAKFTPALAEPLSKFAINGTLIAFAISGFVALTYEVVWTRMLSLVVGSSVYAFSIMLTTFLSGLAIGTLIASRLADRSRKPLLFLALLQTGVGLSAMSGLWLFPELPYWFIQLFKVLSHSQTWILFASRFLIAGSIIALPTILLGAVLPFVIRIVEQNKWSVGKLVGDAYTVNTVGAILGAFSAGFDLIPLLGMRNTITAAVVTNLVLSAFLLFLRAGRSRNRQLIAACPLLLILILIGRPDWNTAVLSSGVYRYAPSYVDMNRQKFLDQVSGKSTTLFYKEGLTASVVVQKQNDHLVLKVNGKPDASTAGDLPTQVMVGVVPILMRQQTDKAMVVGMGSGVTTGAVLQTPVKEVTLVELEQAVVEASHQFDDYNYRPLNDPRLHLEINDGRNFMAVSREKYDLIVSEPSNPWVTGVSNLFTEEYFRLGAQHLNPDGLFCQWLQIYEMPADDVKVLVRTYHKVFPYVYLFRAAEGDLVLVGSLQDRKIDLKIADEKFKDPRIAALMSRIEINNPAELLTRLYLGPNDIDRYAGTGLINTDDNAYIEFQAPRQVGLSNDSTVDENEAELKKAYRTNLQYITSLDDPVAGSKLLTDLALGRVKQNDLDGALDLAKQSVAKLETAHGYSVLGEIYLAKNQDEDGMRCWTKALQIDPNDFTTLINIAVYHLARNEFPAALPWVDHALKIDPSSARAHHLRAVALEGTDDLKGAIDEYELAAKDEKYPIVMQRFYLQYGKALRDYGLYVQAAQTLEKYVLLQQDDYEGHYELAYAYQIIGEQQDNSKAMLGAIDQYKMCTRLKPDFAQAYFGLSNTLRHLGRNDEADEAFNKFKALKTSKQ